MKFDRLNKRHTAYYIAAILILVGCITTACMHHLLQLREANRAYHNASPALCVAQPRIATIISGTQIPQSLLDSIPTLDNIPLLAQALKRKEHIDTPRHLIIIYPDTSWAIWLATHPKETNKITEYFGTEISNGYAPIEENKANGRILHFTTKENNFIHIYLEPGIIGYSPSEKLLTHPAHDKTLQWSIEEIQPSMHTTMLHHNGNRWVLQPNR